jgi:DNA repair photolyase
MEMIYRFFKRLRHKAYVCMMIYPPMNPMTPYKGRGATFNTPNRFESIQVERDPDWTEEDPGPKTIFLKDTSRSIISYNKSPDIGFETSFNPYRGCEHGCIYCYARPTHEYAGMSAGLDFESKILVKLEAPELLRQELSAKSWKPQVFMVSGVTDCYQPIERKLKLTRRCLEVLAEFRNPAGIVTKSRLVTRDLDVLQELARWQCVNVNLSVTTLKPDLAQSMEPRAALPKARLDAIATLSKAGIPVGVMVAPIIPGLTDHEMPAILKAAREAGALWAGRVILRLPWAVAPLFQKWLEAHVPESKEKILHRIREMRGGKLYDSRFGIRGRGEGRYAEHLAQLFAVARRQAGYPDHSPSLSTAHFRRPGGPQLHFSFSI